MTSPSRNNENKEKLLFSQHHHHRRGGGFETKNLSEEIKDNEVEEHHQQQPGPSCSGDYSLGPPPPPPQQGQQQNFPFPSSSSFSLLQQQQQHRSRSPPSSTQHLHHFYNSSSSSFRDGRKKSKEKKRPKLRRQDALVDAEAGPEGLEEEVEKGPPPATTDGNKQLPPISSALLVGSTVFPDNARACCSPLGESSTIEQGQFRSITRSCPPSEKAFEKVRRKQTYPLQGSSTATNIDLLRGEEQSECKHKHHHHHHNKRRRLTAASFYHLEDVEEGGQQEREDGDLQFPPRRKRSLYVQFVESLAELRLRGDPEDQNNRRRHAEEESQLRQMVRVFVPHLSVCVLLAVYVLIGALCFQWIDPAMEKLPYTEVALFCFTTIATIGYGNVHPTCSASMIFTIFYAICGIPICMLAIVNIGKYVTKAYWMMMICLGRQIPRSPFGESRVPFLAILAMFFVTQVGTMLITGRRNFAFADFYFSVVSFSTIGYGDFFFTTNDSWGRLAAIVAYLVCGIIVVGLWFTLIKEQMRRLYYYRRRFRGARDVNVWFGRRHMKVGQVLEVIAREFKASPNEVRHVLNDLDYLISEAIKEQQQQHRRASAASLGNCGGGRRRRRGSSSMTATEAAAGSAVIKGEGGLEMTTLKKGNNKQPLLRKEKQPKQQSRQKKPAPIITAPEKSAPDNVTAIAMV